MAFNEVQGERTALVRSLVERGALEPDWVAAFEAVPRSAFLPDVMWPHDMDTGRAVAVDMGQEPDRWLGFAETDVPIVTQWDDGTGAGPGGTPTSSASMPSVVARMLRELDVRPGHRVLEIGTGTGWNAALLAHRVGADSVVTLEIDSTVATDARRRLLDFGAAALVVHRDGTLGDEPGAPYDRIIATAGLRSIPPAWLRDTRPGGIILAPWGTHFSHQDATVRLVVDDDGKSASGGFTGPVEFMKLRAQRLPFAGHAAYVPNGVGGADQSTTPVTEEEVVGEGRFAVAPFAMGLRVRDCHRVVAPKRDGARPVWLYGLTDRSWACVMFRDGRPEAQVWQSGERRLWDEALQALRWWLLAGQPGLERVGLTITAKGQQRAWLDDPSNSWEV
ncbi:methyltransferase domain-containing protein [Streptomyces sp. NPDC003717]|uniref:methyltransferase domain-containing protein n=1 Tax=Streptomyces sp. NPDC003717 TaxID=3154276 RepID=UPI0033AE85B0